MADHSDIEWTDATWNPITGCDIESPGCVHCYAMTLAGTRLRNHPSRKGLTKQAANGAHVWTGEVRFNEQWLDQPLRWRQPRRIFPCAHSDLFHPNVPDEWIDKVFAVMTRARWHTYQCLTKRATRMRDYMTHPDRRARILEAAYDIPLCAMEWMPWPLPHVWMGVSAEDQKRADERIPELLATPAAIRWVSLEPLIGPIDLTRLLPPWCESRIDALRGIETTGSVVRIEIPRLDWIVDGGESGPRARPSHPDWFRAIRDACVDAGVAYLHKQNGAWAELDGDQPTRTIESDDDDHDAEAARCDGFISLDGHFVRSLDDARDDVAYRGLIKVGKKAAGRLLDGRVWDQFPEVRS